MSSGRVAACLVILASVGLGISIMRGQRPELFVWTAQIGFAVWILDKNLLRSSGKGTHDWIGGLHNPETCLRCIEFGKGE